MSQIRYCCPGCGNRDYPNSFPNNKCNRCETPVDEGDLSSDDDINQRIFFAHSLRRIKRFGDAKKEFNNILIMNSEQNGYKTGTRQAALGYFLSSYEVSEYKWNRTGDGIESCACTSTSLTPVENSNFWQIAVESNSAKNKILCRAVEEKRKHNLEVKNSIPKYRAIIICDQSQERDMDTAHALYKILSRKTDIFFAPVTLKDVPFKEREFYIYQAIRNPDIVELMFVIYSQPFDFQYTDKVYQSDIVRQCEDFAKTHQRDELYSVILGDGAPSDDMNELSIKKINCRNVDEGANERIANALLKVIADHISDEDEDELWRQKGEFVPLNDEFSPLITVK